MIQKKNVFEKGVDGSFNREFLQGADRLHRLENARLFKRGDVGYVSRIGGYENLATHVSIETDILDVIETKNQIFVFSGDGTSFSITIFQPDGTLDQSITYTDTATTSGELTEFEDYLYISPHNRFLVYDSGTWDLKDFISTTPSITSLTASVSGTKATGRITVNSGFQTATALPAFGEMEVLTNTIPEDESRTFKVRMKSRISRQGTAEDYETDNITVLGTDKRQGVAEKIVSAINTKNATGEIGDDWEATLYEEPDVDESRWKVKVTSKAGGSEWNSFLLTISDGTGTDGGVDAVSGRARGSSGSNVRTRGPRNSALSGGPRRITGSNEDFLSFNPQTDRVLPSDIIPSVKITTDVTRGGKSVDKENRDVKVKLTFFGGTTKKSQFVVYTDNIASDATQSDVITAINTALNNTTKFTSLYSTSTDATGIDITADQAGNTQNTTIAVQFTRGLTPTVDFLTGGTGQSSETVNRNVVDIDVEDITGGTQTIGSLEPDTDYWYKARFVYDDGHKTLTSYPKVVNTGNFRSVDVVISDNSEADLLDSRPTIEIFRKKEGTEFFLVQSIGSADSLSLTDSGWNEIRALEETPYVWTKEHKTQEFVNNRYVQANVEYHNRSLPDDNFTITKATGDDDNVLPKQSEVSVYAKPLYNDGTFGFHKEVGSVSVSDEQSKISVQQTSLYDDIREFGFFIESNVSDVNRSVQFNSAEIANQNIPTLESIVNGEEEEFYPTRTRVLYGYKYLVRIVREGNVNDVPGISLGDTSLTVVYDDILRGDEERENRRFFVYDYDENATVTTFADRSPETLDDIRIFNTKQTYVRIASHERTVQREVQEISFEDKFTISIYKLADASAIEEAAFTNQLFLGVKDELSKFKSSQIQTDLNNLQIRVLGAIDKSDEFPEVQVIDEFPYMLPPLNSRIYLQLEESPLDQIDDPSLNIAEEEEISLSSSIIDRQAAKNMRTYQLSSITNYEYTMAFDLYNISKIENTVEIPSGQESGETRSYRDYDYTLYNWNEQQYELFNNEFQNLPLLYIGSKINEVSTVTLGYTPFSTWQKNYLSYTIIKENLLSENKVVEDDVTRPKYEYTNQIIWSEPAIRESFSSGTRNFLFTSFFNLPTTNGEILRIVEFRGRLYAFCERGVAELFVGEVMSEASGGEVFVDTSRFITDYRWIIQKLKTVKPKSIVLFESMIFFSDGFDVYMLSGEGLQNISNGAVDLDGNDCVGGVDPQNSEYWLTDCVNEVTWAYSFSTGEWFGPYGFANDASTTYQNDIYGIINNYLVKHNSGNTFAGTAFDTVIESTANDLNDPVTTKLYRKFYVNPSHDVGDFAYSKDYTTWYSYDLSGTKKVNGQHRIGINQNVRNQPGIYWRLTTNQDGFTLRGVAFDLKPRRRAN